MLGADSSDWQQGPHAFLPIAGRPPACAEERHDPPPPPVSLSSRPPAHAGRPACAADRRRQPRSSSPPAPRWSLMRRATPRTPRRRSCRLARASRRSGAGRRPGDTSSRAASSVTPVRRRPRPHAPPTVDPSLGVLVDTYAWDERSLRRSVAVAHREHGRRLARHGDTPRPPHHLDLTRLPDDTVPVRPLPTGPASAALREAPGQQRLHQYQPSAARGAYQFDRSTWTQRLRHDPSLVGADRAAASRQPIRTRWPPSTSSAAPALGRTAAATSVDRRRLTISPRTGASGSESLRTPR